jgi:hypothetical protein
MGEIRFTACENLDFDRTRYTAKLALISSGGVTKLVWERKDPDGNLQLCQFCKLRGRLNGPEQCLENKQVCGDYKDFEHIIELPTEEGR